jgi:hypothetical protein
VTEAYGWGGRPILIKPGGGQDGHPLKGDVLSVRCPPSGRRTCQGARHDMSSPVRIILAGAAHAHARSSIRASMVYWGMTT